MARKTKAVRRKPRVLWTSPDLKQLRKLAGKQPVTAIARTLKRSAAAVRYKAHILKLSLKN